MSLFEFTTAMSLFPAGEHKHLMIIVLAMFIYFLLRSCLWAGVEFYRINCDKAIHQMQLEKAKLAQPQLAAPVAEPALL
jgi:hypothetical protein